MEWTYTKNTPILIDGILHQIRLYNGMTGIGSRDYWIDDKKQQKRVFINDGEIKDDEDYSVYNIKWRDNPWDRVDIVISKKDEYTLFTDDLKWIEPKKRSMFN